MHLRVAAVAIRLLGHRTKLVPREGLAPPTELLARELKRLDLSLLREPRQKWWEREAFESSNEQRRSFLLADEGNETRDLLLPFVRLLGAPIEWST